MLSLPPSLQQVVSLLRGSGGAKVMISVWRAASPKNHLGLIFDLTLTQVQDIPDDSSVVNVVNRLVQVNFLVKQ